MSKRDLEPVLGHLGLNEKAAAVYLACLRSGKTTAANIAKSAKVPRTSIYEYLEDLESRGLVQSSIEAKKALYFATNPGILTRIMQSNAKELEAAVPTLMGLFSSSSSETPRVRFYADLFGAKELLEEILNCSSRFYRILGYIGFHQGNALGEAFWLDWTERRIKRGVNHQSLRGQDAKLEIGKINSVFTESSPRLLREVRYAPMGIKMPVLIYLFDNKVAYLNPMLGKAHAVVIESKELFDSLNSVFDAIWNISEKAPETAANSAQPVVGKARHNP